MESNDTVAALVCWPTFVTNKLVFAPLTLSISFDAYKTVDKVLNQFEGSTEVRWNINGLILLKHKHDPCKREVIKQIMDGLFT